MGGWLYVHFNSLLVSLSGLAEPTKWLLNMLKRGWIVTFSLFCVLFLLVQLPGTTVMPGTHDSKAHSTQGWSCHSVKKENLALFKWLTDQLSAADCKKEKRNLLWVEGLQNSLLHNFMLSVWWSVGLITTAASLNKYWIWSLFPDYTNTYFF